MLRKTKKTLLGRNLRYFLLASSSKRFQDFLIWALIHISVYSLLLSSKHPHVHVQTLLSTDMIFSEITVTKNCFPKNQFLNMCIFNSFIYITLHLLSFNFTSHFNHPVALATFFCNSPDSGSDLIILNNFAVFNTLINSIFIPFHFTAKYDKQQSLAVKNGNVLTS